MDKFWSDHLYQLAAIVMLALAVGLIMSGDTTTGLIILCFISLTGGATLQLSTQIKAIAAQRQTCQCKCQQIPPE